MKRYLVYLGPIVLYYGLVSYLSSREELPSIFLAFLWEEGLDKLMHALEYALLGLLVTRACVHLLMSGKRFFLIAASVFAVLVLGGLDEWHQSFVAGRDASVFDLLADAVGGMIGIFVYMYRAKTYRQA